MEVLTSDGPSKSILEVTDLKKSYDGKEILAGSTFSVQQGEFLSILGPSGCGKTTTLRILIGLETPTSGTILCDGRENHAAASLRARYGHRVPGLRAL